MTACYTSVWPPAGWFHGDCGAAALRNIGGFIAEHRLGVVFAAETGFIVSRDPDTVHASDTAGFFPGSPDLAVEILSLSNTPREVAAKVTTFCQSVDLGLNH